MDPYYKKDIFVIHEPSRNSGIKRPRKLPPDPPQYASLYKNKPNKSAKYLDDSLLTSSINSMWSEHNVGISRQNSSAATVQTLPTIPAWSGLHSDSRFSTNDSLIFYKDGTLGSQSVHSRDDDDCTTTSGSYTINPDELDDELNARPRDLFV